MQMIFHSALHQLYVVHTSHHEQNIFFSFSQAPDEESLTALKDKLTEAGVDHKVWIEQPENYATCIAIKPYPKSEVHKYVKKFKLYRGPQIVSQQGDK